MSNTFTIEQIEAAMRKGGVDGYNASMVIAELTRPIWKPQNGEVCWDKGTERYWQHYEGTYFSPISKNASKMSAMSNPRPLTPDEVPAWKRDLAVAISAFERIVEKTYGSHANSEAKAALVKLK